jgi:hypothetical protein
MIIYCQCIGWDERIQHCSKSTTERQPSSKGALLRKEEGGFICSHLYARKGIAAPRARRIIGRYIRKNVNCELPSYAMRRCSFLPMPTLLISCVTLPPATRLSEPIYNIRFILQSFKNVRY